MTYQQSGPYSPGGNTSEVAKEQAGRVGQAAAGAGGQVAQTTKEQAQNVVGEAKQQARDLAGEARTQVRDQAGVQRDRAVQGLRSLSDELDQMAQQGGRSGLATEVARKLSSRGHELAGHLERNEPSELLDQVRAYARRRPMVFLAGAALAGVVAGRLTRGVAAGAPENGSRPLTSGYGRPPVEPLAAGAAGGYPAADYLPGTGYEPAYGAPAATPAGAGYQPGYESGYQPGTDPDGYAQPGDYRPADEYGTTPGGFREPEAGYAPGTAPGYPPPAYPPPAEPYEPAPGTAYEPAPGTYESAPEAEEPPARGWNS